MLRVVGEGVAPQFGESDIANTGLLPLPALAAAGGDTTPAYVLVDVAGPRQAAIDRVAGDYTEEMVTDIVPGRVMNLDRVRSVPLAGLAVVVALGAAIRSRRSPPPVAAIAACWRSFAVWVSMARHGDSALVWQGLFAGAVVVLIGIPLGLVTGSVLWDRTIAGLGTRSGIAIPSGMLAIGIAIVLGNGDRDRCHGGEPDMWRGTHVPVARRMMWAV